ncbi:caprin-2-like [Saccoglossus kowalevskii]
MEHYLKMVVMIAFMTLHYSNSQDSESTCGTCMCCTGTAGMPGVPGHNGINGLPGLPGEKGEPGVAGVAGIGQPGKAGPQGPLGPKGDTGSQAGNQRQSAFSATRVTAMLTVESNTPVTFDTTRTNIGNDFDGVTGKFTCSIPGTYVFMYSIRKNFGGGRTYVNLMLNNEILVSVWDDDNAHDMLGNQAIVQLEANDEVWLRLWAGYSLHSNENRYTTFSGFLLYAA